MKKTIFFFIVFLISFVGLSQSLEGEWKGYFTDWYGDPIQIIFYFTKIDDTTFEGTSKTINKYSKKDTSICVLRGGFYEENILLLEETWSLKEFTNSSGCLQFMKLYYRKKKKYTELKGDWFTEDLECGSGPIYLTKSNNKK